MWNLTDDLSNKDDNEDIVDNDKLRHGSSGLFWQQINDIKTYSYFCKMYQFQKKYFSLKAI